MNVLIETNILVDKVAGLLPVLAERGAVYLFAFAQEEEVDRWDMVLSSDWSDKDSVAAVRFVASEMRSLLEPQEMTLISRIAVIPSSDPNVYELTKRLGHIVPKDNLVIHGSLLGSDIRMAYVFHVRRSPAAMPSEPLTGTGASS